MLYIVYSEVAKVMKVGISCDIRRRIKEIQTAFPYKIRIAAVIPDAGRQEELKFHLALEEHRLAGEWFPLNRDTVGILGPLLEQHGALNLEEYSQYGSAGDE